MPSCSAFGQSDRPDLLWKYLPSDKHLKTLWLVQIKRKNIEKIKERNIVLCSEHFAKDCFERNFKAEFECGNEAKIYKLKSDAVPTLFAYKKTKPDRTSSEYRVKREEKRKFIDEVSLSASSSATVTNPATATVSGELCCTGSLSSIPETEQYTDNTSTSTFCLAFLRQNNTLTIRRPQHFV